MQKINHAQIARAAGVSRPTVSRALQNHPALSMATRKRIQELARNMGYRPNPLVSALMAARNQPHASTDAVTLAILTAWDPKIGPPFLTDRNYLKGACQRARELGFQAEEFWLDRPGLSSRRLSRILSSRGIVAVLLAPIPADHADLTLDWERFSIGTFAPSRQIPVLHRASHFHFRSYCLALRELIRLGYHRPALMLSREVPPHVIDQWVGGHYATIAALPKRHRLPPFIPGNLTRTSMVEWCRQHRPDVILSNQVVIMDWLKSSRRSLGRPIAFAHLDRHSTDTNVAGIDQLHEIIGSAAVDLIVAQVNRNERGIPRHPKDVLIEGEWIQGSSAPPV